MGPWESRSLGPRPPATDTRVTDRRDHGVRKNPGPNDDCPRESLRHTHPLKGGRRAPPIYRTQEGVEGRREGRPDSSRKVPVPEPSLSWLGVGLFPSFGAPVPDGCTRPGKGLSLGRGSGLTREWGARGMGRSGYGSVSQPEWSQTR